MIIMVTVAATARSRSVYHPHLFLSSCISARRHAPLLSHITSLLSAEKISSTNPRVSAASGFFYTRPSCETQEAVITFPSNVVDFATDSPKTTSTSYMTQHSLVKRCHAKAILYQATSTTVFRTTYISRPNSLNESKASLYVYRATGYIGGKA